MPQEHMDELTPRRQERKETKLFGNVIGGALSSSKEGDDDIIDSEAMERLKKRVDEHTEQWIAQKLSSEGTKIKDFPPHKLHIVEESPTEESRDPGAA